MLCIQLECIHILNIVILNYSAFSVVFIFFICSAFKSSLKETKNILYNLGSTILNSKSDL